MMEQAQPQKKPRGRPKKSDDERATHRICFRVPEKELKAYEQAATINGYKYMSKWLRHIASQATKPA